MRELTSGDLGILLSLFALLLITFGIDFRVSRKAARKHHRRAVVFAVVSLVGELTTSIALVLTWVALWSPKAWERIDDLLVLVPGSIAVLCAVALTVESVFGRVTSIWGLDAPNGDGPGRVGGGDGVAGGAKGQTSVVPAEADFAAENAP